MYEISVHLLGNEKCLIIIIYFVCKLHEKKNHQTNPTLFSGAVFPKNLKHIIFITLTHNSIIYYVSRKNINEAI
jgi:hypothetical protein